VLRNTQLAEYHEALRQRGNVTMMRFVEGTFAASHLARPVSVAGHRNIRTSREIAFLILMPDEADSDAGLGTCV
jgi:hypothetical protein